jgi:hypothetical protein
MTPLQEYVAANGCQAIDALGISVFEHPTLPLVGFQYDQLDSPKAHPVVRWSRGTVLEKGTWKLVAQPMVRFFNYGENEADAKAFDWSHFVATEKADGSLCILYFYAGEWRLNTSGSFGLCRYSKTEEGTWAELFWKTFDADGGNREALDTGLTYIFEICTPATRVVRMYKDPRLFLVTLFRQDVEVPWADTVEIAKAVGIQTVPVFGPFKDIEEIRAFIADKAELEPAFEGFVLRDRNNIRFKVKSLSYLALHHLFDKGELQQKRLVQLALANEGDEVLLYLPQLEEKYKETKAVLDASFQALLAAWNAAKDIQDQKAFALSVKSSQAGKYSGLLFSFRKLSKENQKESVLRSMWRASSDLIVKNWKNES